MTPDKEPSTPVEPVKDDMPKEIMDQLRELGKEINKMDYRDDEDYREINDPYFPPAKEGKDIPPGQMKWSDEDLLEFDAFYKDKIRGPAKYALIYFKHFKLTGEYIPDKFQDQWIARNKH